MSITKNCETCNNEFITSQSEINRGYGKFCSRSCSSKRKRPKDPSLYTELNCAYCDKKFTRIKNKLKNSKSGLYFCSRKHKDLAQRLDGLQEIHPPHYGSTNNYRDVAFREYPKKCNRCGYKNESILVVHHIDYDRSNNLVENLEVLCPNCHAEEHYGKN